MMLTGAIRLMSTIMDCEKPVIAAVPGTAAGIGAHMAFACDLVLASDNAKFIEVFVRRALVADGLGTWILPRLVGLQKAKELVFFGDDIPAAKAAEDRPGQQGRARRRAGGHRQGVGRAPGRRAQQVPHDEQVAAEPLARRRPAHDRRGGGVGGGGDHDHARLRGGRVELRRATPGPVQGVLR